MSNKQINPATQTPTSPAIAKVIYILLIISSIIGVSGIIAVIMAYVNKDDENSWLQSHYRFQIRTFWIGLLYIFLGTLLFKVLIGYLIFIFVFFWLIIRCAKGLKQLENAQPVKNLESWLFT